jgi:hypothetical protein
MRIHGLCAVKNERDIIEQSLTAAAQWCDHIYVMDNGSDDGTWEELHRLAAKLPQLIPFKRDLRPFHSGIREDILQTYLANGRPGDWWCILDADEFCIDDPKQFLANVPRRYQCVWKQDYGYYFTEADLAAFRADPSLFADHVPVEERIRYYITEFSEIRFFRHELARKGIPWDSPRAYPRRIRIRHYQDRSPAQIQKRLDTRLEGIRSGIFAQENRENWGPAGVSAGIRPGPASPDQLPTGWEERVIPTDGLHFDQLDGRYAEGRPWAPPKDPSLLEQGWLRCRRLLRRITHRFQRRIRTPLRGVRV